MKKKQNKKNMPLYTIGIIIVIIIGVLLIVQLVPSPQEKNKETGTTEYRLDTAEVQGETTDNDFLTGLGIQTRLKEQYQPDRENYGEIKVGTEALSFSEVVTALPPLPEDMWKVIYSFGTGTESIDLCAISKEYYQQPEFITLPPFTQTGLRYWTNPDPNHWVESGEGGFPQLQTIVVDTTTYEGNEPITGQACAFLMSAWGVQTYRGVYAEPYFLEKGVRILPDQTTEILTATGKDAEKYIDVQLTPNIVMLEPTYPIIKRGWIKKITASFAIDAKTPPGRYIVGIHPKTIPDVAIDQELKQQAEALGGIYARPNEGFSISIGDVKDVPPIQFEIMVR